jgi:DNA helicase-2/ATP-dependent DNA helicase PcrA
MTNDKLIIAAAGAGKTTFLVTEALKMTERVLITTYTQANEAEIKKK